jgi:S1-C subfamily serine protease
MDLILFYILEYWLYVLIFVSITIGTLMILRLRAFHHREDKPQFFIAVVGISYLILFSGCFGGFVRPFFTDLTDVFSGGSYKGFGTGSFINPNVVLTNEHVINGCKGVVVKDGSKTYRAKIIAAKKTRGADLALLRVVANKKNFALFSSEITEIDDIVIVPGYTNEAGDFKKLRGKVIDVGSGGDIRISAVRTRAGNSGSPVFNKNGYLVGILWGGGGLFSTQNFITNSREIINFAAKHGVKIFSTKDQRFKLSQSANFLNSMVVNVLCER